MSLPSSHHPLLRLVDANKNTLKCALVKYIDVTVESQFGQLRDRIVHMIESGEIAHVNAPVSTQPNTMRVNSTDSEDIVDNEGHHQINPQTHKVSASVQPSLSNHHQTTPSNVSSVAPSTTNTKSNLSIHQSLESENQIASSPIGSVNPITTEPIMIKQEEYDEDDEYECEDCTNGICQLNQPNHLVGENDDTNNDAEVGTENGLNQDAIDQPNVLLTNYDDDEEDEEEDEAGEYMSEGEHECEDCLNGVCQLNHDLIHENDTASTEGGDSVIGFGDDDQPNVVRDPIAISNDDQILDDSNPSTSENTRDLSLISGQQNITLSVHKSTRQLTEQEESSTSSGLRSSTRKRTQTKVFAYDDDQSTSELNKRKSKSKSKAAKRIRFGNDDDGDNEVDKHKYVVLQVNCTVRSCKTILTSTQMWRQHLSSVHGQKPYKQLEDKHRGKVDYPCTECVSVGISWMSITSHWTQYHQAGKFKCSGCEFVANFREEIYRHRRNGHKQIEDSFSQLPINEFDDDDWFDEDEEEDEEEEDVVDYVDESEEENDSEIGLGEKEEQPNVSLVPDPIIILDGDELIDDSNQSRNSRDLLLINESEQQIRNVRKSTRQLTKQESSSSSGLRSSNRKRNQTKVFAYNQSTSDLNKQESDSRKAVNEGIVPMNDEEIQQGEKVKLKIVILELKCTEPGCTATLTSMEMWRQHLSTCHEQNDPYKHIEFVNARHNHRGQKIYPCSECDFVGKKLIEHWRVYHQEGKFKCADCEFVDNLRCKVNKHHLHEHLRRD